MNKKNQNLLSILLIVSTIYLLIKCSNTFMNIISLIFKIIFPLILGFTIAFLLKPLVDRINRKLPYKISMLVAYGLFISCLVFLLYYISPKLFYQMIEVLENMPNIVNKIKVNFSNFTSKHFKGLFDMLNIDFDLNSLISAKIDKVEARLFNFFSKILQGVVIFVLSIIISAYILIDYVKIIEWIKEKTNNEKSKRIRLFLQQNKDLMYSYFQGVLLVMLIMFGISSFLFYLIGIQYPIVIGSIFAVTNLIPYVGPFLGGIIAIIIAFNRSVNTAVLALLIVIILQFLESNYLTPKIQSKMVNVNPLAVLLTIFIFGELLGIIGMVISVPLLALLQTILDVLIIKKSS